jgi:hypothetical protein
MGREASGLQPIQVGHIGRFFPFVALSKSSLSFMTNIPDFSHVGVQIGKSVLTVLPVS